MTSTTGAVEPVGLYIHIPFCSEKCHYCDFLSAPGSDAQMESYLDLLEKEVALHAGRYRADTIFIGGGTPSLLPPRLLERLLAVVVAPFIDPSRPPIEASIECNPESFDREKGRVMRAGGLDRISFGVQSFDDRELRSLGRRHNGGRALAALEEARGAGFDRINLDLIYGYPGNTAQAWETSVARAFDTGVDHLSAYCFILEEGTRFFHSHTAGNLPEVDEELQLSLYDHVRDATAERGWVHYEISNFSRPGSECQHNLRYWKNQTYLGLGLGAAGFLADRRRTNSVTHLGYQRQVAEGRTHDWIEEPLSTEDRVKESLMLGLRLMNGVDPADVEGGPLTGAALDRVLGVLDKWCHRGLLSRAGDRYALTQKGVFLSNEVFVDLV